MEVVEDIAVEKFTVKDKELTLLLADGKYIGGHVNFCKELGLPKRATALKSVTTIALIESARQAGICNPLATKLQMFHLRDLVKLYYDLSIVKELVEHHFPFILDDEVESGEENRNDDAPRKRQKYHELCDVVRATMHEE